MHLRNQKNTLGKSILKYFWKGLVFEPFNYPVRLIITDAFYGKHADLKNNFRFIIGFIPILRNFFYKFEISERIIEDPFLGRNSGRFRNC